MADWRQAKLLINQFKEHQLENSTKNYYNEVTIQIIHLFCFYFLGIDTENNNYEFKEEENLNETSTNGR